MKSLGKEKETAEAEKDEVREAVEKAKDAFGEAVLI